MLRPAARARIAVGDTTVTYLPDGVGWALPEAFFPGSDWSRYADQLDERGRFPVSIGSFLIRTGGRSILVDLGLGAVDFSIPNAVWFTGGGLPAALAAEGLTPAAIDTVVFTHLHHDHVGWTSDVAPSPGVPAGTVARGLTFPVARHLVTEAEWQHWTAAPGFPGPDDAAVLQPLREVVEFVADGDEIAPGVRVLATPGHTPGHISLSVTDPAGAGDDGPRVLVLGDVMHCRVQVAESGWTFRFDVDPVQGSATRERLLKELEDGRTVLAGGHFADHVFGRVLPPRSLRAWQDGRSGARRTTEW
ncbi:MBL fold metallo-hydrolase [Streptomyces sp. CA-111067]|uniref:MBL fold metallo-hydrolase n=1 Tax=Streptomyces sp. CA-111067 TaxID=3240046 RepID=UPI003D99D58E